MKKALILAFGAVLGAAVSAAAQAVCPQGFIAKADGSCVPYVDNKCNETSPDGTIDTCGKMENPNQTVSQSTFQMEQQQLKAWPGMVNNLLRAEAGVLNLIQRVLIAYRRYSSFQDSQTPPQSIVTDLKNTISSYQSEMTVAQKLSQDLTSANSCYQSATAVNLLGGGKGYTLPDGCPAFATLSDRVSGLSNSALQMAAVLQNEGTSVSANLPTTTAYVKGIGRASCTGAAPPAPCQQNMSTLFNYISSQQQAASQPFANTADA